jgi:hypothetical protein
MVRPVRLDKRRVLFNLRKLHGRCAAVDAVGLATPDGPTAEGASEFAAREMVPCGDVPSNSAS